MAHEDISAHLERLGLSSGDAVPEEFWERFPHAPAVLRWLLGKAPGASFPEGATYRHGGQDVPLGWFLSPEELLETMEDTRDSLPGDVLPIENDGGDNHLTVGVGPANAGRVFFHQHDAPTDRNLELLDESLDHFLMSLRPAD